MINGKGRISIVVDRSLIADLHQHRFISGLRQFIIETTGQEIILGSIRIGDETKIKAYDRDLKWDLEHLMRLYIDKMRAEKSKRA